MPTLELVWDPSESESDDDDFIIPDTDISGWAKQFDEDDCFQCVERSDTKIVYEALQGVIMYPFGQWDMFHLEPGDTCTLIKVDDGQETWRDNPYYMCNRTEELLRFFQDETNEV